jgi:hypothetical protein
MCAALWGPGLARDRKVHRKQKGEKKRDVSLHRSSHWPAEITAVTITSLQKRKFDATFKVPHDGRCVSPKYATIQSITIPAD